MHSTSIIIPNSWFILCGINFCVGSNPLKLIPLNFINVKKILKILTGISSNFLHNISTCISIRKNYKNGELPQFHF